MSTNVPESINRHILERALDELRAWRRHAIKWSAAANDEEQRQSWRQQADQVEGVVFRLAALLHPLDDGASS